MNCWTSGVLYIRIVPFFAMANEVIGWKWAVSIMDYGETFKRQRRYLQQNFRKQSLSNYHHIQTQEVHRLLNDLLVDPDNHAAHFKRLSGSIIMRIAYGHQVLSRDDHFISVAEKGVLTIEAVGVIGAHIVENIPWLRHIPDWMPGAGLKRLPPGTREDLYNFLHLPFEQVKAQMATGTATQCYTTTLMEETKGNDEEGVRSTAAIIYAGGFDTTLSAINTAIVALAANSVIQARAQAEMDVIVGSDRLPTFSDREQMPYMQCIISETFRWGATTPVGVPHRLCEDDYYRSYYLPKDSMIIANAWGMLRDPRVYPNPERFNPDRFLEGEGRTPQPDPRGPAFGFGRRICPGKDFAEDNFWLAVSNILYTFNISPALDENGKPLTIGIEFSENSIRHPKPFKCVIKPRRPNSVALIQQMADI